MPTATAEHSFLYVETDVPAGMTLSSWRDEKVRVERDRRPSFLRRLGGR